MPRSEEELLQLFFEQPSWATAGFKYDSADHVTNEYVKSSTAFAFFRLQVALGDLFQALGGWRFVWISLLIVIGIEVLL